MTFIYLFILGTIAVLVIGLPILRIIKPSTVVSVPVLIGLCVYQFMLKFRNCYTSYFSCTNRILYVNGFVSSAFICVGLSFVFIGPLNCGVWGLIIAQILSQLLYNVWRWPSLAHKEMDLSFREMVSFGTVESIRGITDSIIKRKKREEKIK